MKLAELLAQKKSLILDKWLNLIWSSYPPETASFLSREKDRFQNPVAYQITQGIKGLYEALIKEMDPEKVMAHIKEVVGLKAVQNFSPSQALAFVFLLKKVVREQLAAELKDEALAQECLELESRIDGLALLCFDAYMERREKLSELRIAEVQNRVSALLRRAGLGPPD